MRKYKFLFIFIFLFAVFMVLSWFVYDGIDIFFKSVYSPLKTKTEVVKPEKKNRTD